MIKITDLKNPNGSTRNVYYSKGINRLNDNDEAIFTILSLGKYNEELGDIKLVFDGEEFSAAKRTSKILNFITVNVSKITSFKAVFVAEKENKNKLFESFKEKLLPLKEMEVNNVEDAKKKLDNAIECVLSLTPTYLLFDANVEGEYSSILSDIVSKHVESAPYIFIKDKKNEMLEIKAKEEKKANDKPDTKKKSKPVKVKKAKDGNIKPEKETNKLKEFFSYAWENSLYLISDLLFAFGSTFSLFGIIYFIFNFDITILIIFCVIFLLFVVPFGDSMYRLFLEKYRDDTKLFAPLTSLIIFSILGYAIAMIVSFVFANINFFYETEKVPLLSIIMGFSNIAILAIECFVCFLVGKHKGLKIKNKSANKPSNPETKKI